MSAQSKKKKSGIHFNNSSRDVSQNEGQPTVLPQTVDLLVDKDTGQALWRPVTNVRV
jgi:hypothetical protein